MSTVCSFAKTLIEDFGRHLGVPDVCFNKSGVCRLIVAERFTVDLEYLEDRRPNELPQIGIHCVLHHEANDLAKLYRHFLASNLYDRASNRSILGIDEERDELILFRYIGLHGVDVHRLDSVLSQFVATATRMLDYITLMHVNPASDQHHTSSRKPSCKSDNPAFLKV
ncbi:type III secretion system chaperone [Roseiconus lacunae]|uniref:type III secretion system chaperone n=1 Tax=Roseiconus lacunae TaxID=2605694 RepID=UPI001E55C014|nr:type III secretion system chaperone [Roseiconus lacunae]MCD0457901.1 type III secretion system chaperone [Roseiconus lacunae]